MSMKKNKIPQPVRTTLSIVFMTACACALLVGVIQVTVSWRPHPAGVLESSSSESASVIPENDVTNPGQRERTPAKAQENSGMQKPGTPIVASVSKQGSDPIRLGQNFVLNGKAIAQINLPEMFIAWFLPEGVELVGGDQQGTLTDVHAGDEHPFAVTVKVSTPGSKHIIFRAYRLKNGQQVGHSSVFATGEISLTDGQSPSLMKLQTGDSQKAEAAPAPRSPRSADDFRKRALM